MALDCDNGLETINYNITQYLNHMIENSSEYSFVTLYF